MKNISTQNKQIIPIVLSANDNYAPYLGVCIKSIIENSSNEYEYNIYILISDMNVDYQNKIKKMEKDNISINFYDMSKKIKDINTLLFIPDFGNDFYSIETYYRLFLPVIFENYDKILYLDCDMIIRKNPADLFNIDIGKNFVGVTHDLSLLLSVKTQSKWAKDFENYVNVKLKLETLDNYFQAGVMIWNLEECRNNDLTTQFLSMLKKIRTPRYVDQDVMNAVFKGKNIYWIDQKWNVAWDIKFWYPNYKDAMPKKYADNYAKNLTDPWIIHYTSAIKPWNTPTKENSMYFWQYARQTHFYEEILYKNLKMNPVQQITQVANMDIVRNIKNYSKNRFHYYRCKIMANLTFGKMRNHYKKKKRSLREKIRNARRFLKGK